MGRIILNGLNPESERGVLILILWNGGDDDG